MSFIDYLFQQYEHTDLFHNGYFIKHICMLIQHIAKVIILQLRCMDGKIGILASTLVFSILLHGTRSIITPVATDRTVVHQQEALLPII